MEIALIAFDGLDPRVVEQRLHSLPNFSKFIEHSQHGKWRTPGHTIPSFTATLTGKQYNVTDFRWDEGDKRYAKHRQTGFDYLWDLCGSSMTLLNIPTLYPPEDIEDAMVCGFLTPDSLAHNNLARPHELQDYLNGINYIPDVPADDTYKELGGDGMLDLLEEMANKRVIAADFLIDKYDSDLFYGAWTFTDRWFHQCHKHGEPFMEAYKIADRTLEMILDKIPDGIPVIVFSDHGFAHWPDDNGVHKGHMYEGWYSIRYPELPPHEDNTASIFDLFPTVTNYLGCETGSRGKGRVLFHTDQQDNQIQSRLRDLGYLD